MSVNKILVNNLDSNYTHSIFDISEYTGNSYSTLTDALDAMPIQKRKGGMTIRYVQTVDNKYVQFRCIADEFTIDITKWQGVDNKPIPQSINLIDSASVAELGVKVGEKYEMKDNFPLKTGYVNNQSKLANNVNWFYGILLVKRGWFIEVTRDSSMSSAYPVLSIAADANIEYGDSVTALKGNTFFATQDTYLVISVGASLISLLVSKVEMVTSKEDFTLYGEIRPFESGTCADGTESGYRAGDIIVNSDRICSRFNIVKHGSVIKYSIADGYRMALKSWDGVNVITDKIGWLTGQGNWTPQNDIVFIIGANVGGTAISVSDSANFHILSLETYFNKEIDEIEEEIEEINEIVNNKTISLNTFEQGGVQDGDVPSYPAGSLFPNKGRISTRHNLVTPNKAIDYSITDGYRAGFRSWDGESSLITDKTGWLTGSGQFTPVYEYLYIIVAKVDDTNLLPSVGTSAISVMYKSVIGEMQDELDVVSDYVDKQLSENVIDCWGDSLTQSVGNTTGVYPTELARLTGMTVNNFGDGGESTLHIAGRHGGCPACLKEDLSIPASGGVVVSLKSTFNDWDYTNGSYFLRSRNSGINPCCIGGIVGELSYSANGTLFTRSEPGSAKTIKAGELVYPRWGENTTNHIQIIWIGQNVEGSFSTNEELVEIVKNMIQYYNNDKFLAVCFINRNAGVENVIAAENAYKKAFGIKSFCPREYLNHFGIEKAIENGYIQSATAQDELDIAAGLIPSSLRSDAVHLNTYGYKLVAQRIYELMVQNKYI